MELGEKKEGRRKRGKRGKKKASQREEVSFTREKGERISLFSLLLFFLY